MVEGARIAQFEDQTQLQVILQVAAHPRQFVLDLDAQAFQQWARANPRTLQNARRTNGAGAQDDFALGLNVMLAALPTGAYMGGATCGQ